MHGCSGPLSPLTLSPAAPSSVPPPPLQTRLACFEDFLSQISRDSRSPSAHPAPASSDSPLSLLQTYLEGFEDFFEPNLDVSHPPPPPLLGQARAFLARPTLP